MSAKAGYERGEEVVNRSATGIGGYPNPEDPMPPGPWDPVIRAAIERAGYLFRSLGSRPYARQWEIGPIPQSFNQFEFGASPDPWRMGPIPEPWNLQNGYAELNPQPLPPVATRSFVHAVALTREVLERAEYLQQSIEAARTEGSPLQGDELASRFVLGFAKHFTTNLTVQPRDYWGDIDYGRPPRPNWLQAILIGCLLKSAATYDTTHTKLRLVLEEAGNLLLNAGLTKQPGAEARPSH